MFVLRSSIQKNQATSNAASTTLSPNLIFPTDSKRSAFQTKANPTNYLFTQDRHLYHIVSCVLLGSKLLWFLLHAGKLSFHSLCCDFVSIAIKYNLVISTEGALRLPMTYDNHPSNPTQSHPSTYSCEDDLSIEGLI